MHFNGKKNKFIVSRSILKSEHGYHFEQNHQGVIVNNNHSIVLYPPNQYDICTM